MWHLIIPAKRWVRSLVVLCALPLLPFAVQGRDAVPPFEEAGREEATRLSALDLAVERGLQNTGTAMAPRCSDAVFLRRVYLDLIGTLPEPGRVRAFLADRNPAKRTGLVHELLARDEFADYWATRWCDLLRVKAEFPINLWPNAVQGYHQWIHAALRDGMPYDAFARELLTASGSNFRVPPVNFYRACQGRAPQAIASAVALTWMGSRIETWPEESRKDLEVIFSRITFKPTEEWKEEIVCLNPAAVEPLAVRLPDGRRVTVVPGMDPRAVFAGWLLERNNRWFARAMVNRTWAWLMGRGIIQEPDDIRPDNAPTHPELLAELERGFVADDYDFRKLLKRIVLSRTYQQSSVPAAGGAAEAVRQADRLFARYPARRLDAEVLSDAFYALSGSADTYVSMIPEPFTYIPGGTRAIALADGSVTSPFLDLFGRPARDTGQYSERNNEPSDAQSLHTLNSTHIQRAILRSGRMQKFFSGKDASIIAGDLYVAILSRPPEPAELEIAQRVLQTSDGLRRQGAEDLAWALINSKEFLYKH